MSPTLEAPALTSPVIENLRERILALPPEERELLLASVSGSVDDPSFKLHSDWDMEIKRRVDDLRSGKVQGIPAEDVFREIDEILDRP
jgi:putative addiction module component (TIGR02574 family)